MQHLSEILPSAIRAAMNDSPHRRRLEKLANDLRDEHRQKQKQKKQSPSRVRRRTSQTS